MEPDAIAKRWLQKMNNLKAATRKISRKRRVEKKELITRTLPPPVELSRKVLRTCTEALGNLTHALSVRRSHKYIWVDEFYALTSYLALMCHIALPPQRIQCLERMHVMRRGVTEAEIAEFCTTERVKETKDIVSIFVHPEENKVGRYIIFNDKVESTALSHKTFEIKGSAGISLMFYYDNVRRFAGHKDATQDYVRLFVA